MMHEITNFRGGVVTNVAYHPGGRTQTAEVSLNNRVNDLGWLIPRKGHVRISDFIDIDSVFSHRNLLFVIADNRLYWGVAPGIELETVRLQPFQDVHIPVSAEGNITWSVNEDILYVQTGETAVVVEIPEFLIDGPVVPAVNRFYLPKIDVDTLGIAYGEAGDAAAPQTVFPVELVFVPVKVVDQPELPTSQGTTGDPLPSLSHRSVVGEQSEPVKVETVRILRTEHFADGDPLHPDPPNIPEIQDVHVQIEEGSANVYFTVVADATLRFTIETEPNHEFVRNLNGPRPIWASYAASSEPYVLSWDGNDQTGNEVPDGAYWVRIDVARRGAFATNFYLPIDKGVEIQARPLPQFEPTVLHITMPAPPADTDANYVDIYSSFGDRRRGFYWIARMPYAENAVLRYYFPIPDDDNEQVIAFEQPNWAYIAINEFRAYIAEARSNRIYLSFYDPGTGERLYQNFTDYIDLELGEGYITGLHFLRNNRLIVFATNQIQIVATDPLVSRHSVLDFIKPRDDNGLEVGCAAPNSIVDMGGMLYFLGTNKYVYAFNGQQIRQMSDAVQSLFNKVLQPRTEDNNLALQTAIGFAHGQDYVLSVANASTFPNTTMVLDRIHNVWWQDDFGVVAASKGTYGRIYGVIDGQLFVLYEGEDDNGRAIQRTYKSNPYYTRAQDRWESVHIYTQAPAVIDVKLRTEQAADTGQLVIDEMGDWFSNRMGCNLRGRVHAIEFQTDSPAAIDRITTNERLRNR